MNQNQTTKMNTYLITLQNSYFHTFILEVSASSYHSAADAASRFVKSTLHHRTPTSIPCNIKIVS